ncbi:hypothetical protein AGMMS50239_28450 [Bacteroidia bacterium]|nr:hypothetical protein AGMMS50239_28450 [Bacteroidia bacterium]
MKINKYISMLLIALLFLTGACSDEVKDSSIEYPNDVIFNELELTPHTHKIPDAAFSSKAFHNGSITFNVKKNADGTHTGFALSSRNYRSYPWSLSTPFGYNNPSSAQIKEAVDTCIYSVYSGTYPNQLGTFSVVRVEGDEAYFTLDKPRVVEHILVANTTYNYLLLNYGSVYSAILDANTQAFSPVQADGSAALTRNPNIPDASASKFGIWRLPTPNGDLIRLDGQQILFKRQKGHEAAETARGAGKSETEAVADSTAAAASAVTGYFKLTAKGFKSGTSTGSIDYYLATRPNVAPAPYDVWNVTQGFWAKADLSALGQVDKVVFYLDSSDKDANGNMRTPPYFCIDGIRLSEE